MAFDEKTGLREGHCQTALEKLLWNINESLTAIRSILEQPARPQATGKARAAEGAGGQPKPVKAGGDTHTEAKE